jgi:hypothetical protein
MCRVLPANPSLGDIGEVNPLNHRRCAGLGVAIEESRKSLRIGAVGQQSGDVAPPCKGRA